MKKPNTALESSEGTHISKEQRQNDLEEFSMQLRFQLLRLDPQAYPGGSQVVHAASLLDAKQLKGKSMDKQP